MLSVVLLALMLLSLPSCYLWTEFPERQLEPPDVEELGFDDRSVPAVAKKPIETQKTARQYVREGYHLLLVGKEREARRALQSALRQAPKNKQAALLLRQIEGAQDIGSEFFPYRIQPNDTLMGLAQRFLGDPLKFYLLAKYNHLPNPSRILAGQIINIPGKPEVPPEPPAEPEVTPPPPAVAEPAPPPAEALVPLPRQELPPAIVPEVEPPPVEPAAAPVGRYYAVVIGIDAYAHLGQLNTAVTDAMAITQVLEEQYGFSVIFMPDATRSDIMEILENLRAILTPQDHLLIYYAGHGFVDEEARGYWLPQEALPDVRSAWLATDEITEMVKAMAARHVIVIADSCYSGTGTVRQAEQVRRDGLRSRTVMTSGGLKPVVDPNGGQHSVFAKALLAALYTNDERLEGQRLFAKMRPWVVVSSSQKPVYAHMRHAEHEGGDFLFVPLGQR